MCQSINSLNLLPVLLRRKEPTFFSFKASGIDTFDFLNEVAHVAQAMVLLLLLIGSCELINFIKPSVTTGSNYGPVADSNNNSSSSNNSL